MLHHHISHHHISRFAMVSSFAVASLTITVPAFAESLVYSGTLSGQGNHKVSGTVEIYKTESGFKVVLGEDFRFAEAPDPKLGFGNNGYDPETKFAVLQSNRGKQTYFVSGVDVSQYNEFWIWCERFSVPLGVAKLQ